MKNNGKGTRQGNEEVIGHKKRNPGITPIENWENDFSNLPSWNNIEKILEFPTTSDMAGVLARANFTSNRQRIAAVRLAYKNRKFNDGDHQEMLRDLCASTLGDRALGKIMQVFAGTNLLAPDMFRAALGMQKSKKPEEVHRGRNSELRADGTEKDKDRE